MTIERNDSDLDDSEIMGGAVDEQIRLLLQGSEPEQQSDLSDSDLCVILTHGVASRNARVIRSNFGDRPFEAHVIDIEKDSSIGSVKLANSNKIRDGISNWKSLSRISAIVVLASLVIATGVLVSLSFNNRSKTARLNRNTNFEKLLVGNTDFNSPPELVHGSRVSPTWQFDLESIPRGLEDRREGALAGGSNESLSVSEIPLLGMSVLSENYAARIRAAASLAVLSRISEPNKEYREFAEELSPGITAQLSLDQL